MSQSDQTDSQELLLRYLSVTRPPSSVTGHPSAVCRQPSAVWNAVVAIADHHGLTPLLYTRLKESDAQAYVPADVWEGLKRTYVASAVRSMCFYRDLQPVLRCLRSSGIKVIALKGAFLAEAVYGDDALRPMTDVDLMVPRADLPRAHAVLHDIGRVHQQPSRNRDGSLPPKQKGTGDSPHAGTVPDTKMGPDGTTPLSFGGLGVVSSDSTGENAVHPVSGHSEDGESRPERGREGRLSPGAGIDLCWTFDVPGGRSKLDTTSLWDRARPATIAGVEVLALSPEDLLLHLCLHAAHRHGLGDGLRPLCDVSETIQRFRGEIDPEVQHGTTEITENWRVRSESRPSSDSVFSVASVVNSILVPGIDWQQVVERAREWGAARYVGLMLHLARSMLGAAVPDAVLEQLVPGGIDPRIKEAARESVLARAGYMERMPFFGRLGAKSLGEKARLSWERVFLSRGEMAVRYPRSRDSRCFHLYYALRLRDVIRTYWSHTFRRGRLMAQSRGGDREASLVNWLKSG